MLWSLNLGHAMTGTPAASAYVLEFQPQCVTKHPIALCASTCACLHHATTLPLPQEVRGEERAVLVAQHP